MKLASQLSQSGGCGQTHLILRGLSFQLLAYKKGLIMVKCHFFQSNPDNLMSAQDSAKKVADITTQMCFSLDPKTKRRSSLLMVGIYYFLNCFSKMNARGMRTEYNDC